ncbi:MAG TPA: hypothetical protein VFT96_03505 [Gemmatimonadaceae bacterium]|jgi:hypothetical protein|nr:hypothetical protein [Gemmatimonadaceae bacterium]
MAFISKSVRAGIAAMRAARTVGNRASTPTPQAEADEPGCDVLLSKSGYIVVAG